MAQEQVLRNRTGRPDTGGADIGTGGVERDMKGGDWDRKGGQEKEGQ